MIVAAVGIGAIVAARAMFISAHDLAVIEVVLVAAATVGVTAAVWLGATVAATSSSLVAVTRRIGTGPVGGAPTVEGPPELVRLARELDLMEQRLDDARRREQAVEQSRRELVAWVSHDLRTPLAAIRAMVEALEDGVVADPETVARYHSTLRTEADRLAALVDDLFELSRTQSGVIELQLERVSLDGPGVRRDRRRRAGRGGQGRAPRGPGRRRADRGRGLDARGAAGAAQRPRERDPAHARRRLGHGRGRQRGRPRPTCRSSTPAAASPRPTSSASSRSATRWTGPARRAASGLGLAIARGFVEAHHGEHQRGQRERRRPVHGAPAPGAGRVSGPT